MLENSVERFSAIPSGLMTVSGIAASILFNVGFFYAVGFSFISLFSFQEHIVFSLSGAAIVLGSWFVFQGLMMNLNEALKSNIYTRRARIVFLILALAGAGFYVWSKFNDGGISVALAAGLLMFLIAFFIVTADSGYRERGDVFVTFAFAAALPICVGFLYGMTTIASDNHHRDNFAVTKDGQRHSIVRLGTSYSLLGQAGLVYAVKSEDLLGIYVQANRRPDSPESIGEPEG